MLLSQCLQINIEVLSEPFCQGSYNGGQLHANVQGGSGEYTYEWVNASGSFLPEVRKLIQQHIVFFH